MITDVPTHGQAIALLVLAGDNFDFAIIIGCQKPFAKAFGDVAVTLAGFYGGICIHPGHACSVRFEQPI